MDASLARLGEAREELTKAWLLRLIERTPLEEIEQLPTDRIVRELPDLIHEALRAVSAGAVEEQLAPGTELYRRAARLAALRGPEGPATYRLSRDIASLEAVLMGALRHDLRNTEPEVLLDAVERLATVFGAVQSAAVEELLKVRSRELEWLANTDGLTGLYNFRYLQQHMTYLLEIQQRYGHPFAVLLLDVDGLKRINDSFGHAMGDRALVGVAGAIRETIRTVDVPVRMGGDEFCILAPYQTAGRAKVLGERLASAVEGLAVGDGAKIGVSIGVVSCPQHAMDSDRLLELADAAMYRAKAAGEPVVVVDLDDPGPGPVDEEA